MTNAFFHSGNRLKDTFGVIQCVLFLLTNCLQGTGLILNNKVDYVRQNVDHTRLDLVTNIPLPMEGLYIISFSCIYTFLFFPWYCLRMWSHIYL